MKTCFSLLCIALTLCVYSAASAQRGLHYGGIHQGGGPGGAIGESVFRPVSGDLYQRTGSRAGRVWFETNLADNGLGFNGSYLALGGKRRIGEDRLDGRWLFEAQLGHSVEENGGFFANVGIERVFSIPAAGADLSVGVFYDYDGDRQALFANTFHQVGVSAAIKSRRFDLIGNGYFPTGIQDNVFGDPNGEEYFFGNNIVLVPGIDSALEGFDVTLRMRPKRLAFVNGYVDLGGYGFNSDLVDAFGGGRVRVGFQILRGLAVNLEVNQDNRFGTTGVVGLGWIFGAHSSGFGNEYSQQGRDLEQTVRNDRIVRYNQDAVLAIDPDTGLAYNVIHVNNTSDPAFENGSAELPFNSLQTAQAQSSPGDIIFVNAGDGTDRNQDMGIALQDNQRLFGSGAPVLIPIQDGMNLNLNHSIDGNTPTISNNGGFAVVTLADNNDVAGIDVDATGSQFGIFGNGDTATIRNNTVSNAVVDGVRLAGTGDVTVTGNTFADNGRDGLFLLNQLDQTATITIEDNLATGNLLDGISLLNYDPLLLNLNNNTTNNNLRHGLFLENYVNSNSIPITILAHTADSNAGSGVFLLGGSGNLDVLNSTITNNSASGLLIENWTTVDPERILIGTTDGGVSTISNNGAFANLEIILDDPGAQSRVLITGQSIDNGVRGIAALAEGFDPVNNMRTTLDIDIIDNISVSGNLNDGIRLTALDSGLIRSNIGNATGTTPLQIVNNGFGGGDGIALLADGVNGQPPAEIDANIDNVFINNDLNLVEVTTAPDMNLGTVGIGVDGINNSVITLDVTNSTIGAPGGTGAAIGGQDVDTGIDLDFGNNGSGLINRVVVDNVDFFTDIGVDLFTNQQTFTDFRLANSNLRPNGAQSTDGVRSDDASFVDGVGSIGVLVTTFGQSVGTGLVQSNGPPTDRPNTELLIVMAPELISDGVEDNLTRVTLVNNSIQDFTFQGVQVNSLGDSQVLLDFVNNDISNNGAGFNNDNDNDNNFDELGEGGPPGAPGELFFFDGVDVNAFDDSVISASFVGNTFRDNFERGLSLNTFSSATINAVLDTNVFFGNDRGEDVNNTTPPIGVGTAMGPTGPFATAGQFDLEIINNEEFFTRDFESFVFTNAAGVPVMLNGMPLPANSLGVFFPGNTGMDIFGNIIAQGDAELNVSMSNNSLQLGPEALDFSIAPGDLTLGLDGLTNGFGFGFIGIGPGVTPVGSAIAETLFDNERLFFDAQGF